MTASITIEKDIPAAPKSILSTLVFVVCETGLSAYNWRLPYFSIVKTAIHDAAKYSSHQRSVFITDLLTAPEILHTCAVRSGQGSRR